MSGKKIWNIYIFLILICLFPFNTMADTHLKSFQKNDDPARDETLIIGKISTNPKKHHAALKPLALYAVSKMKDLNIRQCQVIFAKDIPQMVLFIKQKKIDWITETPYSAIAFKEQAGAEYLVRRWKKGVPKYHSVIVSKKGTGINALDDLNGKKIAFESSESTSAFLMPHYALISNGLKTQELKTLYDNPDTGRVGYFFSGQEINSSIWLFKNMVDAIAFSNLDWDEQDHTPAEFKKTFQVIHETKPFPRAIELVRSGLPEKVKLRLKEILIHADKDPKAKEALKKYQKTTRFDEIDESVLESLNQVKMAIQTVNQR